MNRTEFCGWLRGRMISELGEQFISVEPLHTMGIDMVEGVGAIKGNGELLVVIASDTRFSTLLTGKGGSHARSGEPNHP